MKKRIVIIISFLCFLLVTPVNASEGLELFSEYAYLVDPKTDIVYIDQKSDQKIYPASMTKILTVSLALEKIKDIHEEVMIEQIDLDGLFEAEASVAGFYAGEKVTYEDLLYGALLPSGADACNALARLTYGNQETFVNAMNSKAESLQLANTHFENVTGLHDDHHYTTVQEMSVILEEALKNPEFVKIFEARTYQDSKRKHTWNSSLQRAYLQKNIDITHIDGAKSGFTDEAELTLASTMTIDGHQLILVTAYAKGQYTQNHVKDAVSVYTYMNQNYHQVKIYQENDQLHDYWIIKTFEMPYHYMIDEDLTLLLDKSIDKNDLDITEDTQSLLLAPLTKGEQLGTITMTLHDKQIYVYTMILNEDIPMNPLAMGLLILLLLFLVLTIIHLFYKVKKIKRKKSRL